MDTINNRLSDNDYHVKFTEEPVDVEWDDFLRNTDGGHHVQTSMWGRIKTYQGWNAKRFILLNNKNKIIGGGQMLERKYPLIGKIAYFTKGPIIQPGYDELTDLLMESIIKTCRERAIRYLLIQPANNGADLEKSLPKYGFNKSILLKVGPVASFTIDLKQDLDTLFSNILRKRRTNIRNSEKEGISIYEGKGSDLDEFYALHKATSIRQGFSPYPLDYYQLMWETLSPGGHIHLIFVKHEDIVISASMVIAFGKTILIKIVGWSGEYPRLHPNDTLIWQTIKWGQLHGYEIFDMEGINLDIAKALIETNKFPEKDLHTPAFHKYSYGGKVVLYPEPYDMFFNPVIHWIYKRILVPLIKSQPKLMYFMIGQLRIG